MKAELPPEHLAAWRALYLGYWTVTGAVDKALAGAGLPSLAWYDVLYTLHLAPGHRLRMNELAGRVLLSRSGLTRLVDNLVKKGLLRRRQCPEDGRGFHAELTDRGLETLRKIWPVYRAGIAEHFAAKLTAPEAAQLAGWLQRLHAGAA